MLNKNKRLGVDRIEFLNISNNEIIFKRCERESHRSLTGLAGAAVVTFVCIWRMHKWQNTYICSL